MLFNCLGDFNARISGSFSYNNQCNRNGSYLQEFINENNLYATNTAFKKRKNSLWTWRSPNSDLSQIDFILCRKRWRNSIHDSQDHRIVVVKCKISLQSPKSLPSKKLNWQGLSDPDVANKINRAISENG